MINYSAFPGDETAYFGPFALSRRKIELDFVGCLLEQSPIHDGQVSRRGHIHIRYPFQPQRAFEPRFGGGEIIQLDVMEPDIGHSEISIRIELLSFGKVRS